MIADWPRSSVVIVVGTLSSSTHTYSGSLGTSPKRGFLMRSHRVSADLITTEGSPGSRTPRSCFTMLQPERARVGTSNQTRGRVFIRRGEYHIALSCRGYGLVLDRRLPREALLFRRAVRQQVEPSREERDPGNRGDVGDVQRDRAAALEQHRHDPAHDLEVRGRPHGTLRPREHFLHAQPAAREHVADGERIDHLEALAALQQRADQVRHPPEVGACHRHVQDRRHRDLDAATSDPRSVLRLGLRLVGRRDEGGHRVLRLHPSDLGPAEYLLVTPERFAGERMGERRALAEDRVLLADLAAATRADVEEDLLALRRYDDALDRLEGLNEFVGHHGERRPDAIGQAGGGGARDQNARQHRDAEHARHSAGSTHQNVTEGWCTPKTARRRSQISPSVAACSTASTSKGMTLSRPRAARSRTSRARLARASSRLLRTRSTRSASAWLTPGSTAKSEAGGSSSVTNSLTPTTMRRLSSTSRCQRYAASWISRCMKPMACTAPPCSSMRRM